MAFDSSNRISKVTDPATGKTIGRYEYDDQGFRVRKLAAEIVNGAEKTVEVLYPSMYFAIEKQRNSIGVEIPNTAYAVNNIYLNGVRVAASLPNGECQYYLTDQVDSVSVITDDKASVVNRFEYLPFGEAWATEGDGKNRAKYNSQELDAETNFYFYNARYYDPEIARFVTADNVIDGEYSTQGWNRFLYCHGNPIVYKDPTGHLAFTEHFLVTYEAARDSGKSRLESARLAASVAFVDFRGTAIDPKKYDPKTHKGNLPNQDFSISSTSVHAMAGRKDVSDPQSYQDSLAAQKSNDKRVKRALKDGDLSLAIHSVEDRMTPMHDGKKWEGFKWSVTPKNIIDSIKQGKPTESLKDDVAKVSTTYKHLFQDTIPTQEVKLSAIDAAKKIISDKKKEE